LLLKKILANSSQSVDETFLKKITASRQELCYCSIGRNHAKSQRDLASKPKVARNELPWVNVAAISSTLKELCPICVLQNLLA